MSSNSAGSLRAGEFLKKFPDSIKIYGLRSGTVLDYTAFSHRVSERADMIQATMGVKHGQVVIGQVDPVEVLVNLFAVWAAGHCAVIVNPELSSAERARVVSSVTPGLWIASESDELLDVETPVPRRSDAALVLMTSGTAGKPKGVVLGLEALETRLSLNIAEIGADALSNTLCPLPLYFGHGLIGNCLTPLFSGQSLHVMENSGMQDFATFGALIYQREITFLSSVPSMWRAILRLSPPPDRPPRRVHVGSAPLPLSLWDEICEWCGTDRVFNAYGMTELASWISGSTRPSDNREGFVGRPWGGSFGVLRDGEVQSDGIGEVVVRSPSKMLGLWGEEMSEFPKDGFFRTGDIGELAFDQNLRLIGRTKNEINRAGIKVLAEEVDMLLERHSEVQEACSFGMPDEVSGELVGAVVTISEGATLTSGDLIRWCSENARVHAVPHRIEIVEELPKTERGKLARRDIQMQALKRWC